MKKRLFLLFFFLSLAFAAIYFFFPATQKRNLSFGLGANAKALQRTLLQQTAAYKKQQHHTGALQLYPGAFDDFIIAIKKGTTTYNSQLKLLSLNPDSTVLFWSAVVTGTGSPWQRVQTYRQAQSLEKEAKHFLQSLQALTNDAALYGINIVREKVRDTAMVAVRFTTAAYPQTADIYKHVALLQQYINTQKAVATNHPMLHVRPAGKSYETMIALPTSKALPGNGSIELKRMIRGNILMTEVQGGQARVEEGMQQLDNYVQDHNLVSPAIPFASLVTDRSQEPDSSKWITKLYYPIF